MDTLLKGIQIYSLFIFVSLLGCTLVHHEARADHVYHTHFSSMAHPEVSALQVRYVFRQNEGLIEISNTGLPAEFCPVDSEFHCVISESFTFAVPKEFKADADQWSYAGVNFKVKESLRKRQVLGKELAVVEIIAKREDGYSQFLYSPQDGLIAFGFSEGKTHGFSQYFWTEMLPGFAAKLSRQ